MLIDIKHAQERTWTSGLLFQRRRGLSPMSFRVYEVGFVFINPNGIRFGLVFSVADMITYLRSLLANSRRESQRYSIFICL